MTKLAPTELVQVDAPSQLFKQVVDRNDLDWPNWLISSAPAALVASEQLVRQATDNRPATGPLCRWRRRGLEWVRREPNHTLSVFPIGKWWFITRVSRSGECQLQLLAFIFESAPLCTDNPKAARRVAEHYHFMPAESAGGIFWSNQADLF